MISIPEIAKKIKSQSKFWIVFTGDSITSTEWVHPNWREIVEYVLKEELTKEMDEWKAPSWGVRTFNFAYDGATTADILDRVPLIKLVKPDLVISIMGGNDRRKLTVEEHIKNIKKIIEELGTMVIWCNSIYGAKGSKKNNEYNVYAKADMQIIGNKKLQLINMFDMYNQFPVDMFYTFRAEYNEEKGFNKNNIDDAHPNQLGNAYIAKVILKEVFSIEFDPEKYIQETLAGEKYPSY